jgi:hypothetical protein
VTTKRDEAVRLLESLLRAVDDLEACLRGTRKTYGEALDQLQEGIGVAEVLDTVGAATTRQSVTESLAEFEQRRHESRLSLIAAGLEEGMTINGVSKAWGISRQLASRYAKETRGES